MFESILTSSNGLLFTEAAICTAASIILGIIVAVVYILQGTHTKNFVIALAILPALVQVVIMMVNGNLGAGIAVMGAFSLVRFRSVPGSAKEIVAIFFSMSIGLATGMGYISFAAMITIIISLVLFVLSKTTFGENTNPERDLRITIPESLNYTEVFDDIFENYLKSAPKIIKVKTTNMGSMYEITYRISLKDMKKEKEMIDAIRCRNGNLTVICSLSSNISETI